MLSPRAIRYDQKTSAEARRHSVALAIAAPLAAAAIEEAFRSFFRPSVCQMRGKDEPRCGSDVFLCGFNRDQLSSGCVCLGHEEQTKPDACRHCGKEPTWIEAFDRWSVVDDLCEDCYEEEDLGRCEDCCVKLSGDDKGNTMCQSCLEQEAEGQ